MRESTHYELNLVEGTDKVNPLVQDVPNYETIDEAMYNNKCASIGIATELRTGTVHALVRQNEDAPMFRFTATSNYASGDTFTVDGVQVSALLVDGTPLPNMAYIIGSEVLCVLKGTLMTVFANRTTSSDSDKLGGKLPAYYATDADLDSLGNVVDAHTGQINQINNNLSNKANASTLNAFIARYEPWTLNNTSVSEQDVIETFGNNLAPQLPNDHYNKPIAFNCSTGWYYGSCTFASPSGTLIGYAQNTLGQMFSFTKFSRQSATWQAI